MPTTRLGASHSAVTALGIGTWSWGERLFWGYGKSYGFAQVKEAYEAALKAGITFFDTAEVYGLGESETLLGQFMHSQKPPVQIATKYGPLPWRIGVESVRQALSNSLKRLQLEQITLYQVHWPWTFLMSQEKLMDTLADEVEKGRIASIGVSNYSTQQMRQAHALLAKRGIPLATNQVQYSLLFRSIESEGLVAAARELDVTILAYSPLAQGLLTGKYRPQDAHTPEGARRFDTRFSGKGLTKIEPVLKLLSQLGDKYDKTPGQVALNWLIAQGNVIPIPGAKTAQQVRENAGALGWNLTVEEVTQLAEISRPWQ